MPRRSSRRLIYWDACIFIAWMKNEERPDREMDGVFEAVEEVKANRVRLITASTTVGEIREARHSREVFQIFQNLLKRRNAQIVPVDARAHGLAATLRAHYATEHKKDGKGRLGKFDSEHLAVAIHYQADAFYTFDKGGSRSRSLLSLNGNVAGHPLVIRKPPVRQLRLLDQ